MFLRIVTMHSAEQLILIIEDQPDIADILKSYLERGGYRVVVAADGQVGSDLHSRLNPDLVLLDMSIPLMDGWQVLSEIRHRGTTPVIIVTARDDDTDKVAALRFGADDYVTKPFNPSVIVARVGAVLRRSAQSAQIATILKIGRVEIDQQQFSIFVINGADRQRIVCTRTEFKLMQKLARNPTRVYSRAELLATCLPESEASERTVDSHISKLRKKLEDAGAHGIPLSVRGVGYCAIRSET